MLSYADMPHEYKLVITDLQSNVIQHFKFNHFFHSLAHDVIVKLYYVMICVNFVEKRGPFHLDGSALLNY